MLAAPVDIPISPPPAEAAANRPIADGPAAGQSFGEHLKRARADEQTPARQVDRSGEKQSSTDEEQEVPPEQTAVVQLIGTGISSDVDAAAPDAEISKLLHTCLTTECEHEPAGKEAKPNGDEAPADAIAGELIAQAAPLVVLQVSTEVQELTASATDDVGQSIVGKPNRSERAADPTTSPAKVPAKASSANSLAAAIEPAAGALEKPAEISQAVASDEADRVDALQKAGEPHVEPASPSEKEQSGDADRGQSAEIKHNGAVATGTDATLSSVTLVAPGVLPQSASVATISAASRPNGNTERAQTGETANVREPGLTPVQLPDDPAAEARQAPPVRESAEPARHTRETSAAGQNEVGRTNLSEADRVRFVQRVARAVHTAVERGGEVRLRLSPPELGRLTLDVVVRDGVLSARLEAETQSARSLLIDNLPALRERLLEQQVRIDRFDVNLRDGASESLPDRTPNQSGQHPNQHAPASSRSKDASAGDNRTTPQPTHRHIQTNDQLNVVV
jgi:flagellar hook-length control protein FliK